MAFSTLTRYLRLKIRTDLSQQASVNLARLDALGNTFSVGETDDLEIRSRGNVVLKPEATAVGGSGSGGEVHVGTSDQPVAVKFFASSFEVAGGAGDLVTTSSSGTLTNKSISGLSNLLSNIAYSSLNLSGSIKNSDIAADAAIADSKLATISSAGKVNVSALTGSLSGSLLPSYTNNSLKYLRLNSAGSALEWSELSIPDGYSDAEADARVEAGIAALKGLANGLASLDSTGKVPSAQLPTAPVTSVNGQTGAVSLSIPTQYTDTMADSRVNAGITAVKGLANGLASLGSDGKLPTSQLPSLAITSTNVVSSQAAMLALSAEEGDVAIRTDNGKTYLLAGSDPTSLANWKEVTAGGAVTSVNGQSGNVSLSTTNISEGTNLYFTSARAKDAAVSGNITDSDQGKAPTLQLLKSYAAPLSNLSKATWSGTNSLTVNHNQGTKDVEWTIFDLISGERIVVDDVTWGANNNSFTLTLPTGVVAGSWRVLVWTR